MQSVPYRVAAFAAVIVMFGALSGCASLKSSSAKASAEKESGSDAAAARESGTCYLGIEFSSRALRASVVQVEVDGDMVALLGAGDKTVVQYEAGMRRVSVAHPKASKKKREKNSIDVELKPFVYTKIVIEALTGKKNKKRLLVRVLEDGEEVRKRAIQM